MSRIQSQGCSMKYCLENFVYEKDRMNMELPVFESVYKMLGRGMTLIYYKKGTLPWDPVNVDLSMLLYEGAVDFAAFLGMTILPSRSTDFYFSTMSYAENEAARASGAMRIFHSHRIKMTDDVILKSFIYHSAMRSEKGRGFISTEVIRLANVIELFEYGKKVTVGDMLFTKRLGAPRKRLTAVQTVRTGIYFEIVDEDYGMAMEGKGDARVELLMENLRFYHLMTELFLFYGEHVSWRVFPIEGYTIGLMKMDCDGKLMPYTLLDSSRYRVRGLMVEKDGQAESWVWVVLSYSGYFIEGSNCPYFTFLPERLTVREATFEEAVGLDDFAYCEVYSMNKGIFFV